MTRFSPTATLADFAESIRSDALSPSIKAQTGRLLLDFLGVAARGQLSPSTQTLLGALDDAGSGEGPLPIIATGRRAQAKEAAFVHGLAAHSLELDDLHNASSLHPAVVVFPAALAAAQMSGASPGALVAAVVAGYEVATRLGEAVNPATHYARGFHPTATCGVFGSATAAGKLLGLDAYGLARAWGISGHTASGSMAFLSGEAWTKHLNAGWASQAGLSAAVLARRGFLSPEDILESPLGFLHAYAEEPRPELLTAGLGERWAVEATSLKPHACCRYMQPGIDALIGLSKEHDLKVDEVASVTVHCLPAGFLIIAEPTERKMNPQGTVEAQFSMPYGAAVALAQRRAGLEEFSGETLRDPGVRKLLSKVRCVKSEELGRLWPRQWAGEVEVETTDGRRLTQRVEDPKGDPTNPLTEEELVAKFSELTEPCFPPKQRDRLIEASLGLGGLKSLKTLWDLLPAGG